MVKISIIVPVYNVEDYLEKCLKSLVNQTLKDIEIIVVNDGSPDNSQEIIDKYTKKYPKIVKSYVKKNGGLSDARNYGIKNSKGEYIAFVDSDDYVEKNMLEKMYQKAIEGNFDIVVCDVYNEENGNKTVISSLVLEDIKTEEAMKRQMVNIYPAAWNKIYKKELFNYGVNFKKGVWYEDVEFLYRLIPYVKTIGTVRIPLINYVQRDGAITKTFDERLYHYIDNWNGIIDFYKKQNFYDKYKEELEYCYIRYLYATFIKGACNFPKNEFKKCVNEAIKNVNEQFPNYKNNKYFKSKKGFYLKHFNSFLANILFIISGKARKC